MKKKRTKRYALSRVEFGKYTSLNKNLTKVIAHLFAERNLPVLLNTWGCNNQDVGLPSTLKFRVRQFSSWLTDVDWCQIQKYVHETSFPLDFVKVEEVKEPIPIAVKSAKKLVVVNHVPLDFLEEFNCVDFEMCRSQTGDYSEMIRNWLSTEKPIGTCFKFGIESPRSHVLGQLRNQFNGNINEAGFLTIPINYTSKIEVSIVKFSKTNYYREWNLSFQVVAV